MFPFTLFRFQPRKKGEGFPGGTVVKSPPANAGDTGSSHGPGSYATEQLSPCATAAEPALWNPRATTTEPTCHNY